MSVYLDYNATAPLRAAAFEAMVEVLRECGNPSSVHGSGRRARRHVEEARARVAGLVGAKPDNLIFTSGGTEANALALLGSDARRVLISAVEHPSVRQAVPDATLIPVDRSGLVDLAALERLLRDAGPGRPEEGPLLVSIMFANNETGVIQPVAEAARLAHAYGALIHADCIQGAGKVPLDIAALGVDLLTLSAHKIGGPQGVGAVVAASDEMDLTPVQRGGGQEGSRRAGTENVAGIVAFGVAAQQAGDEIQRFDTISILREGLERRIAAELPEAVILGQEAPRLPNTLCVAVPGLVGHTQVMALDLAGIEVSAGSACSSGKVAPSAVLKAMGLGEEVAAAAIRVSLGWDTTAAECDLFMNAWRDILARAGKAVLPVAVAA